MSLNKETSELLERIIKDVIPSGRPTLNARKIAIRFAREMCRHAYNAGVEHGEEAATAYEHGYPIKEITATEYLNEQFGEK